MCSSLRLRMKKMKENKQRKAEKESLQKVLIKKESWVDADFLLKTNQSYGACHHI